MCSNTGQVTGARGQEPEFADRLAAAIDAFAAAAGRPGDAPAAELAARLASTWAMLTSADAELAARTARYAESAGGNELAPARARSTRSAAQ